MTLPVLKGAAYTLAHTPNMLIHNGTTQTTERITTPDSEYLKNIDKHLRSYEEVLTDPNNQTYINNMHYSELKKIEEPRFKTKAEGGRYSKRGEIMPEIEFYGLLSIVDVFDLVYLEEGFAAKVKEVMAENEIFKDDVDKIKNTESAEWLQKHIDEYEAEGLYYEGELVGVVSRAHDIDPNLNAHIMLENLVNKASGVLSLRHLLRDTEDINAEDIEYVIEASEEAIGDMNQRGGGNMAKAIAELCGLKNASGSDLRAFCGAPTHALISAASLVRAGTYKAVAVVAGGSTAKLGMNGKSHYEKDMPLLEDSVAGVAYLISQNDGKSPVIRTDVTGRHTVSSGSSPQAVMTALVGDPLDKAGLTIPDVDIFSVEMQNPDITKSAGAGDVPTANLKMIGAVGVLRKELERADLANFVAEKGIPGWAPTQGHIPSGAPYLGFAYDDMTSDSGINRAMIVGKGSLFLGRMTNLFDGVSIIIERNSGEVETAVDGDLKEVVKAEVAKALRQFAENFSSEEE
ncbi:glycine/sarcosine/betaine reductase complex component C subunit beta [Facklamia sp. P12934]|uniref:glycine/sarcosine/betaine reductase complex component C subunit beta n=1 Tax=unclassified Facklamia TaxID=2622293 RepID=UPI003D16EF0A